MNTKEKIVETLAMAVTHSEQGEYAKSEAFVRKIINTYGEAMKREERERILNSLPRHFWEDSDHADGGYISKRDLKKALTPTDTLPDNK